jgi:hypothetical protein
MYFYSWGDPMHLQNHKLQTCKKQAMSVLAFHKIFLVMPNISQQLLGNFKTDNDHILPHQA